MSGRHPTGRDGRIRRARRHREVWLLRAQFGLHTWTSRDGSSGPPDAGLTIAQLSDRSGISYNTLRRRLLGDADEFTIDELDAIADATGKAFGS